MRLTNSKDKKNIQQVLKQGLKDDFWDILTQALKQDLKDVNRDLDSDDLSNMPANEYKVECEVLKEKRRFIEKMLHLPDRIIEDMETPPTAAEEDEDPDPYPKDESNEEE